MEFTIDKNTQINVTGDVKIEMPKWMTYLTQDELNRIKNSKIENVIIACGFDHKSNDILALTSTGKFYELNLKLWNGSAEQYEMIPETNCYPTEYGFIIEFEALRKDINSTEKKVQLSSKWFIERARLLGINISM